MNQYTFTNLTDLISDLNISISVAVLLAALLGLLLLIIAIKRLWQRKLFTACLSGSCGLCLALGALLALAIAINIHTYQRLTYEKPLLTLTFEAQAPQHFRVRLNDLETANAEDFELYGDEWQLDARILRWKPPLQILGKNSGYRLERLSGRYDSVEQERAQPRSVYSLKTTRGLDIWKLARDYQRWFPWLDAYYGSATYLPMRDGARYTVSISQYGLIARPDNDTAKKAIFSWN